MPDDNLSAAQKEAYAVARANDPTLETVEIAHPQAGSVYMVRDKRDFTANLDASSGGALVTFEAVPFRSTRPNQGETGASEVNITIDNADLRISRYIDKIKHSQEETELVYRPYLASDPSGPSVTKPQRLTVVEISRSLVDVIIRAKFVDVLGRPFPSELMTRERFPSLGDG